MGLLSNGGLSEGVACKREQVAIVRRDSLLEKVVIGKGNLLEQGLARGSRLLESVAC